MNYPWINIYVICYGLADEYVDVRGLKEEIV